MFYIPRVLLCIILDINLVKSDEAVHHSSIIVMHYVK